MTDFLKHLKVQDASKFSEYVLRSFEGSSANDTENVSRKERNQEANVFLSKCMSLVQHMIDIGQNNMVLLALATLKSVHHYGNPRLRYEDLYFDHAELDKMIKAFVTGKGRKASSGRWVNYEDTPEQPDQIEFRGLSWTRETGAGKRSYHNFARAARILRAAYLDIDRHEYVCTYGDDGDDSIYGVDDPSDSYVCFHRSSIDMLEWLQTSAWSEIRYTVMLTTGSSFPAEIAERVFDFALEAEEIPSDPRVKETVTIEASDSLLQWKTGRRRMRPKRLVRPKSKYKCEGFAEPDEFDLFWTNDHDEDPDYELIELKGTFMDFVNGTASTSV